MAYDPVAVALRNEERRFSPRPGDIWDERCNVVMVVLDVTPEYVTIVQEKIQVSGGYYFDLSKAQVLTRQEFSRKPCYGGTGAIADRCWCHVGEKPSEMAVKEWAEWLAEPGHVAPVYRVHTSIRDNFR